DRDRDEAPYRERKVRKTHAEAETEDHERRRPERAGLAGGGRVTRLRGEKERDGNEGRSRRVARALLRGNPQKGRRERERARDPAGAGARDLPREEHARPDGQGA